MLVLLFAGDLEAAGLELLDTGFVPHYDVVHADLRQPEARLLGATPGGAQSSPQHRRLSGADDRSASRSERRGRQGLWWSLLGDAAEPAAVVPAVLIAGSDRFWSVVRIDHVDDDGQVHFVAVPPDAPAVSLLARSA